MAWTFQIWIESGNNEESGIAIRNYFESQKEIVTEIGKYQIIAHQSGETGSMITVDGISQTGIDSELEKNKMSLIGNQFYVLLKNAPEFRYALTGIEVDGWREMSELVEEPNDILLIKGFVIRKDIYKLLGYPGEMSEFKTDYLWTPYEGEYWNEK